MLLSAKDLLKTRQNELLKLRTKLSGVPTLALIWVGDDKQTATFINKKQAMAKKLSCQFSLHHFPDAETRQLKALIEGLNSRPDVAGIVLQLPLPDKVDTAGLIETIDSKKDIDNLRGDDIYGSPTVSGIIDLLRHHQIPIEQLKTVVLGAGKLVGAPLAKTFAKNGWSLTVIAAKARQQTEIIAGHDLLISATGVKKIVTPTMVSAKMIVIDGSGIDVDVEQIEPLVKAVTPQTGAIGPLTVSYLFSNLLQAARQTAPIKPKA